MHAMRSAARATSGIWYAERWPIRRATSAPRSPRATAATNSPVRAGCAAGSAISVIAEQHEAEADDERRDRAERGVARALRKACEHGGGGMRVDCVIVDDGSEWLGHGACIGRFRQDLEPPNRGTTPLGGACAAAAPRANARGGRGAGERERDASEIERDPEPRGRRAA